MNKYAVVLAVLFSTTSLSSNACDIDSYVLGLERNTSGCEAELNSYGSVQPGGQCVSLLSSAELFTDYLNSGNAATCSQEQKNRANSAVQSAASTIRRAINSR